MSDDLPLSNPTPSWLNRMMWLGVGLAIGLTVLTAFRPRAGSMTTDTRSASLPNDRAKVEFLQRYLKLPSEVEATEFHIRYKDNGRALGGAPSDFDLRVAVKVPPGKVAAWTADLQKLSAPFDLAWAYELLPKDPRWAVRSPPNFYQRETVQVATFEPEGIVFKRVLPK